MDNKAFQLKAELFTDCNFSRFGHSETLMMTEICTFSQKCLGSKHMGMLYNRAFMENSSGKRIFVWHSDHYKAVPFASFYSIVENVSLH